MLAGSWIGGAEIIAVSTQSPRNLGFQRDVADYVVAQARGQGGFGVRGAQNALFRVDISVGDQWQEFVEMPARRHIPRLGGRQRLIEYRRGVLFGTDPFTEEERAAIVILATGTQIGPVLF